MIALVLVCSGASNVSGQVIDFETLVAGQTLFGFDANGDGRNDVQFSTTDPLGFNTAGPVPENQAFVSGAVLESSSLLDPDIRVDFLGGAVDSIDVGYVLGSGLGDALRSIQLDVFDLTDTLIGTVFQIGEVFPLPDIGGESTFPEGSVSVSFDGVADYALLDATTGFGRFVIDDFGGEFLPAAVPEPSGGMFLMLAGLLLRRKTAVVGRCGWLAY